MPANGFAVPTSTSFSRHHHNEAVKDLSEGLYQPRSASLYRRPLGPAGASLMALGHLVLMFFVRTRLACAALPSFQLFRQWAPRQSEDFLKGTAERILFICVFCELG